MSKTTNTCAAILFVFASLVYNANLSADPLSCEVAAVECQIYLGGFFAPYGQPYCAGPEVTIYPYVCLENGGWEVLYQGECYTEGECEF